MGKEKKGMNRRQFFKRSAGATVGLAAAGALPSFARAAAPPVSPVAVRKCKHFDRSLIYSTLVQMFSDLDGAGDSFSNLVNGKKVGVKLNLTYGRGSAWHHHSLHSKFTDTTHPDVAYALAQFLIESGAAEVNFLESSYTTAGIDALMPAMGYDMAEFTALGNGSQVHFYDTRNKQPDAGNGWSAYAQLDPTANGVGSGDAYMFDYFYVNKMYAAPQSDVIISLAKLKGHEVAGVTLGVKNMFGCLPNSIYGGSTPITEATGPDEDGAGGRTDCCHNGVWNPYGEKDPAVHGVANFDSERMPRLIVDLCRALPIDLVIVEGIKSSQPNWGPSSHTSLTTPGVMVAGFNPICTDAVCVGIMGQDPRAAAKTGMFLSGENYLNLAAAKEIGSNDLSRIPVLGESIANVRYDYYPHVNRSSNNQY
ncbi:MAG: DUF362 domain-containing protein [bacterium]